MAMAVTALVRLKADGLALGDPLQQKIFVGE